jgi:O-antigen/teichoic acid export membrane protein
VRYRHLPLGRRLTARLVTKSTETLIAVFCLIGSLPRLAGAPAPQSVEALFPPWLRYCWGVILVLGGATLLAGVLAGRPRLERPALSLLAGATLAYAAAILGFNGPVKGGLAAAFVVAIAAMCVISLLRDRLLDRLIG